MMGWGNSRQIDSLGPPGPIDPKRRETIELIGPHLRVRGEISLFRFTRLSDLINHSSGFVKLTGAQLLRRNGDPTGLVVRELMVNPDEITFVGQREGDVSTALAGLASGMDRPLMERMPRELVIFTAGHTLIGTTYLFSETDIASFVDSPDPRFIPMVSATARSLADRRVISHFGLVLVNRTQITAASLRELAGGADETGVSVD